MKTEHQRTALITGANKGIGKEIARQLAQHGFAVFIGARDMAKGRETSEELCQLGYESTFIHLDVTDPVSIKNASGVFSQKADHLDVLINNAGILEDHGETILKLNTEMLDRTLKSNVTGPILVIQDFLPYLQKSPMGGRIINVSSGAGALSKMDTYAPAYSISKTALNAVTKQFAGALKQDRIAVNCVDPGWVRTDMGGANASRPVEKGAETIVWLATDAPQSETGKFWHDKQEVDW
ncbi:SDR family oxidoreductase [Spirosoma endophyticum]|uniref:NAD(P)-dependent dehydrogenase, short-chain alcohol dehydrogenase family n=1 Tax=Spirosoma endophyticum TaxID=662367 RepID=A0A1I1YRF6_9BACT|nr:SDR family oxidoreductase [Spirosoma endophyticum]SFE22174.1 NAD(P)-dependent dehydrogenase, short-chain alcohol dehydrogenase family [Spirosoma endophyticum]